MGRISAATLLQGLRAARSFIALAIVAGSWLAAGLPAMAGDAAPLAMKGYDPVAYFVDSKPTPGRPDIDLVWDDHRYQFASDDNRARFKAEPARYAPQFSDYCAMALSKGELVVANPENWTIAEDKLYIFGKPAGPELFRKDLAANQAKAEANRKLIPR